MSDVPVKRFGRFQTEDLIYETRCGLMLESSFPSSTAFRQLLIARRSLTPLPLTPLPHLPTPALRTFQQFSYRSILLLPLLPLLRLGILLPH